jgi:glycosyltransferase involved in cell wall biosynthesis
LREIEADLLFCPFTAGFFHDSSIPMVSTVYDLQYADYPQFFSPEDRAHRQDHMLKAARLASRLVCISEHVRGSVIKKLGVKPERVKTVHIQAAHRLIKPSPDKTRAVIARWKLTPGEYLFYPANFWQHKNHQMLLTAFGMFCRKPRRPELKLVFTGQPGPSMDVVRDAASRMGIAERVVFAGYVSNEELAALLDGCRAMVFPSLYEGFGMPVLEAMSFGKTILCGNRTSLPEIAGECALLFDPKKPGEILSAIEALEREPDRLQRMAEGGPARASLFSDPAKMALSYADVFKEVLASGKAGAWA